MRTCLCGNPLGPLATSCPKCGRTFIGRTALIVTVFIVALAVYLIAMG